MYLLHLMPSSTSLVAYSAVLSSLSWFPRCVQCTLRGWVAGEGPKSGEEKRASTNTGTHDRRGTVNCLLQTAHQIAPSLDTQHLHTYLVTSSKDLYNLVCHFIHSVLCLKVAQDIQQGLPGHTAAMLQPVA